MQTFGDISVDEVKASGPMLLWAAIPALLILPQAGNLDDLVIVEAKWSGFTNCIYVRNINGFWSKREFSSLGYIPNSWSPNKPRSFGLFRTKNAVKAFALKQRLLGKHVIYHPTLVEF